MDWTRLLSWKLGITVAVALAAGSGTYYFWPTQVTLEKSYLTAPVEQGNLVQTVSANGTLNPVSLINVGTQVSGVVRSIHADFNDKVEQGQVLLELDPSLTEAQLAQSEASLASATASLDLARANLKRTRALYKKEYVSRQDLDTSIQAERAAAAQLAQAAALVKRDRVNLGYAVIRSPVAGVVVSREVDVGQTVAASFQTPTLFRIAQDLTRMQIDSSFAEADIGSIRVGQKATFNVDAYPGRDFAGTVRQVRLNPTTQQNVVTYNVVIDVNNVEGILLPGMTAYVNVVTAQLQQVLKVPNAALRFRPAVDVLIEQRTAPEPRAKQGSLRGSVYMLGRKGLVPVRLRLGASDNETTEVLAGALAEGDLVVIDTAPGEASGNGRTPRVRIH